MQTRDLEELRRKLEDLERSHAVLVSQVKHIDDCTDEAKEAIATLSGRLFGSPGQDGEIFNIKGSIRDLTASIRGHVLFLAGVWFVIQFLFGSGLFSLVGLMAKK